MGLITEKKQVLDIYSEAEKKKWTLPCFCTENLTTTEAILEAARQFGEAKRIKNLPVIVAITCKYDHRSQATNYTHTGRWDIGMKLFLEDLKVLTDKGSPYEDLRVMIHLDHIQCDDDIELLSWDMNMFSSIMFDASKLPFRENIKLTSEFVREKGHQILVEGACDEIVDASGNVKSELTSAQNAEEYFKDTGVDLIVANLGTEHRASAMNLEYYGQKARDIKDKVGNRIVLHGASSVLPSQIGSLFEDGVCKVNIWTALERDSTPVLFRDMVVNASKVVGNEEVELLKNEGLLGERCETGDKASLGYFTTLYRQNIVFNEIMKMCKGYFELWYK